MRSHQFGDRPIDTDSTARAESSGFCLSGDVLFRSVGLFSLLLTASTWRLWIPQDVFPRVPLFEALVSLGAWADWLGCGAVTATSVALVCGPSRWLRRLTVGYALSMAWLMLLDQHRVQPWAYHLFVLAVVLSLSRSSDAWRGCRWILLSIYLFSAVSKFDYQFLHTLGQQFLDVLLGFLNIRSSGGKGLLRILAASCFPWAEFLIALGLMWSRTRRLAAWSALSLHGLLLLVLGPIGLHHHVGVWVWNLFFMTHVAMLYLLPHQLDEAFPDQPRRTVSVFVSALFALLPLGEPLGWMDHWPAWQLYAPRNSRATMYLLESAAEELPQSMQSYLKSNSGSLYVRLDLDRWSLESLHVPIYPQDRFQLGVAAAVVRDYDLSGIQVVRQGVSQRLSGARRETVLRGRDRLDQELASFRINAIPK